MTSRTKLDEAVAEALGDILQLHDTVKALPAELQKSLAPSLGALAKASKEAQETIKGYTEAQKVPVKAFADSELERMRKEFQAVTKDSLAAVGRDLEAATAAHYRLVAEASGQGWRSVLMFFAGAILAGFSGAVTVWYLKSETPKSDEYLSLAYGRGALSIWGSLDKKVQKQIQEAVNQQEAEARERLMPQLRQ